MKIALVRLDKIGDLVCTLPVDQLPALRGAQIWWIIAMGLGFIPAHANPGRRFLQINKANSFESFVTLVRFFRREKIGMVVSFQGPWWVSFAALVAGVKLRVGVRSQWHSFLFLNRSLRQRRSLADRHEADYNRELMEFALQASTAETRELWKKDPRGGAGPTPLLSLRAPETEDFWSRIGLRDGAYVIVHPGMAGSAKNWPQKSYVTLIRELIEQHQVVITGTPADEPWLGEIRRELAHEPRVRWLVGEVSSTELLRLLEGARLVIAPSTGVAHLAAALGRPVVSIFSSVRVQSATRWAPRGPQVRIVSAPSDTPDGMEKIRVEDVLSEARTWL